MKQVCIMLTITVSLFTLNGCKKNFNTNQRTECELIEDFFKLPQKPMNSIIKRVYDDLKRKNELSGFAQLIAEKHGLPVWEKAQIKIGKIANNISRDYDSTGNGTDTIVQIPIANYQNSNIPSFIRAKLNGSITEFL